MCLVLKVLERVDETVDFSTVSAAVPGTGLPSDYYSVRWLGLISAPYSEIFTFKTVTLSSSGQARAPPAARASVAPVRAGDTWPRWALAVPRRAYQLAKRLTCRPAGLRAQTGTEGVRLWLSGEKVGDRTPRLAPPACWTTCLDKSASCPACMTRDGHASRAQKRRVST